MMLVAAPVWDAAAISRAGLRASEVYYSVMKPMAMPRASPMTIAP